MIGIDGVDYQVSCMLRKTDDRIVLKSCPFQYSEGHGDRSCMLLLMMASDNPDEEIEWKTEDLRKEIFGESPPSTHDYQKIAEWKFPNCPMKEVGCE